MTREGPETAETLLRTVRACRLCHDAPIGRPLPIEPNPILVLSSTARLCIAGQAPGNLADRASTPFDDPSGTRLRDWLGVGKEVFYDPARVAVVPMGFCFPGTDEKGGDRPPRRECRTAWHARVFAAMPQVELVVAIGLHAQAYHLGDAARGSLTETVADWRAVLAGPSRHAPVLPLPHPSWRNSGWIKRHPLFSDELLPELRRRVADLV